uniref:BPTI/Kunitz inhibitor domain-containing protein n=1 Tax=Megaselia scalaris TaxID=36166 RepID=T1GSH7_MEGSC
MLLDEFCKLQAEKGPCRAIFHRYFYNVNSNKCELFTYGGCDGNENNFRSQKECISACIVKFSCAILGVEISFRPNNGNNLLLITRTTMDVLETPLEMGKWKLVLERRKFPPLTN